MAFLLAYLKVPLTWRDVFKRALHEAFWKDNCLGLAAQLAYYFFFALFPALLFLIALASYFPLDTLIDDMFRLLGGFVPPEILSIITDQIKKISEGQQGGLLTIGVLTALWSSSSAMTAAIDTLNRAYDVEEGRPWWKVRLTAILLTVGVALFILVSFALVVAGPTVAERLANVWGLGPAFEWTWKILQWPIVFALASIGIALIYYFAPDVKQDWIWLTPGSVFATLLWLLATLGFKFYVANMGKFTETYGAIGGVMVLMLWFYISGLVILIGAEMNAVIEHASPHGKDPGEKVAGQKRMIGTMAMRAWIARRRRRGQKVPSADEVSEVVEGKAPVPVPATAMVSTPPTRRLLPPARRFSDWLIAGGVLAAEIYLAAKALSSRKKRV
ncbi:MAG TPA: YihY/virulence factor BrkB family protein [Vicinamibacterales bacterium]|jgi:membrane protein|nr:YihY/virulence factor BrkB family protein [Vicinamibacterales bacterium]